MKKLIFKSLAYSFLILIALELLVRVFYLGKDTPSRYVDQYNVEKWKPNQNGYAITGNRRQNFSAYHINKFGYNSYREYEPSENEVEIALVGDSFIEGFHQNYYNSIGKKIEKNLQNIKVYEYGYAGYDMADQLHLIHAYKSQFDLIDHIILGIKFSNDLTRSEYKVITERLALESPLNKLLKKSKLIVYCQSIGVLDPPRKLIGRLLNLAKPKKDIKALSENEIREQKIVHEKQYLDNFKSLVSKYGYDKKRYTLLLDSRVTSSVFLEYLNKNQFDYIDFSPAFEDSHKNTTLIYDKHWNNHGRNIIAKEISDYIHKKTNMQR